MGTIGKSVIRKEAYSKVTGAAKYTADFQAPGMLHAAILTSPYAHARILDFDVSAAWKIKGVRAILAGEEFPLVGEEIRDRPPIAVERVRHYGEVVALVVADTPVTAKKAANQIKIQYEPLPVVNSAFDAFQDGSVLVHEKLDSYQRKERIYPIPGTNVAHRSKIRKGSMEEGWKASEVTAEASFSFGPSDHAAMETRCAIAEIRPNGEIVIITSSQAPYMVKNLINEYFGEPLGNIIVETPLVGGGYGGKASVQQEILAYLASKAVGGKPVKLLYSREEDLVTASCHIGLHANVKFGCTRDGKLRAAEILFLFDGGAYSDKSVDLSRAAAVDCTGPYQIDHVWCDSYCMYTNHPYAGPFRGFSHSELSFAIERTLDILAQKLKMDPLELRYRNAILPGHTSPTQVVFNQSNLGNLRECINKLKALIQWDEGQIVKVDERKVRVKGVSCSWKTSTIETDASSGVILTFNSDGSINLMSGVIEIGTGTKTVLAQILAERLQMDIEKIHVRMQIDTQTTPEHWKTVASRGTFMAGNAVLQAAEDVITQLKDIAAVVLKAPTSDLEVADSRVYLRDDPAIGIGFERIVYGYQYPNGNSIGGQIIGKGHYILRGLTHLDPETGAGKPGPEWTVSAHAIEIEFDRRDYTYRIIKAASVIDIGRILNEKAARGQVMGAMSMGLAYAGRESFIFDQQGRVLNPQLRTYRPIHYGENPHYLIDFVETPQKDAPYGARGVGEHGILGMPAALGNGLSIAAEVSLHHLPLTPELIWRTKGGMG
ncbi:xanthine dehydrogenase family protein molybdopterin-binding subunit [Heyndrickxia acidicola]|uniref:Xanthine dehydrogenase family protein molybdopterin-binding subunit n=1 Tax=Heyndrickxia acidicola TaxID=209389 RepID=A0ABU6MA99_9BACI|nr:xanthine dehydrogenase family protein molybdopterin-binding subunit [Heyndrickxia acidicola]MED1201596.1 xanthine dehydrogenase family protein molybdopterin-binding subunit [Heyndrickxia acidicola]